MYQIYVLTFCSFLFLGLSFLYYRFMQRCKPRLFLPLVLSYFLIAGFLFFFLADFIISILRSKGFDTSLSHGNMVYIVVFLLGWMIIALATIGISILKRFRAEKKKGGLR